jgi:hypothetical protein
MGRYLAACALAAMAASCGSNTGGGAAPDAGGNPSRPADTRASRPTTTVENPGEPEPPAEDLPPDEAAAGDVAEGTDAVGACYVTSPAGVNARLCVDYNDGYDADSAGEHCRAQSGTFNAGQGCDRTNARLVGNCTVTEMMRTRVAYAYRIPATRAMPDPPTLDAEEVTAWCQTQMGTAPAPEAPTNTGRCVYRTNENLLAVSGVMACVNYDQGFSEADARANCAGRTASTGSPTFAEQSCSVGAASPGCRFAMGSQSWTIRYNWPYRSSAPWDDSMCASDERACFRRDCEAAGGMFFTGH